jgi:hypothetical protein
MNIFGIVDLLAAGFIAFTGIPEFLKYGLVGILIIKGLHSQISF